MHDIDRTQQEWGGSYEYGPSSGYITAGETPLDEILGEGEYEGEYEAEYYETSDELTDGEVMELASELLEVQDEAELDHRACLRVWTTHCCIVSCPIMGADISPAESGLG